MPYKQPRTDSDLNLSWITTPPIIPLLPDEVEPRARRMRENIAEWYGEARDAAQWPPLPVAGNAAEQRQVTAWNTRLENTNIMAWWPFGNAPTVVEYRVQGEPVGIMSMTDKTPFEIKGLLMHPGSADGGGLMVEWAVNHAAATLGSPKVILNALDGEARDAYAAMGFVMVEAPLATGGGNMALDPAASPKWTQTAGGWRLKKYAQRGDFIG